MPGYVIQQYFKKHWHIIYRKYIILELDIYSDQ